MKKCVYLAAAMLAAAAWAYPAQQQNPPSDDKRAQPAGPPQNEHAPAGERHGPQQGQMEEMFRQFLAIGKPPDPEAAKRGQAIFVPTCGFCHGTNATGGAQGPSLVRSVVVLHDQGTGKEVGVVVRNGRPEKGMPAFPNMTDDQIHDIAQFLLGRTQAAANRMSYKIQNIVTGDAATGQSYFTAHCSKCHSADGDLANIAGKYDPVTLQGRFLYPQAQNVFGNVAPDPKTQKHVTVTLPAGATYNGVLVRIDDFSLAMRAGNGEYHSWNFEDVKGLKYQIEDPLAEHLHLLRQYTDKDMHDILAYLETLK